MWLLLKVSILIIAMSIMKRPVTFSYRINFEDECETPDKSPGNCMKLEKCDELFSKLRTTSEIPKNRFNTNLLQRYHCGFEGSKPKVCCPLRLNHPSSVPKLKSTTSTESPSISDKYGNDIWWQLPTDDTQHRNLYLLPTKCGDYEKERIYGGGIAGLFDFPWMALLFYRSLAEDSVDYDCGGTIINNRYILTAAHCLVNLRGKVLDSVRIGEHNIETQIDCEGSILFQTCAPTHQNFGIEKIITNTNYSSIQMHNDIALIRLNASIEFGISRYPICLPIGPALRNSKFVGVEMTVAGWGKTENEPKSKVLLETDVPVVDNAQCGTAYINVTRRKRQVEIIDSQICAGGELGIDSCTGDSGGPLMSVNDVNGVQLYVEHGIVSNGPTKCGALGRPAVYTRVAYFMNWILDQLEP